MQLAADDEGNYDHNQNLNARKIQTKASDVGLAISMSSQEHGEEDSHWKLVLLISTLCLMMGQFYAVGH